MTKTTDEPDSAGSDARGIFASNYARSKRDLMNLVNQIRATGAAVEVDLPTIVVAGNQSSGKSSLIEAISGINLPRAAGTCTRVPIEVRLRQEVKQSWKCVVKIRRELSDEGEEHNASGKAEFPFGPTITEPRLVESTIRRAQLAILNPSVSVQHFVDYVLPEYEETNPLGSTKQLAFSRNVVVLEITGPDVVDLTLVDLPGIVQYVSKGEDENNVDLVTNLVKSYIQKDCLILLVITMKDDIQNQKAVSLAQEVDPEGKRTIGVLTKADTLRSPREIEPWIKVLKGETERLLHGYFVTRQPNVDELAEHITFDQARAKEADFFSSTTEWNGLPLVLQRRLGTKNLTTFLSDQLMALIREKLPSLTDQIKIRYNAISEELTELGSEPSGDPVGEMMSLINEFHASIEWKTQGGRPGNEAFLRDLKKQYKQFKLHIRDTRPNFSPTTKSRKKGTSDASDSELEVDCVDDLEDIAEPDLVPMGKKGKVMDLNDVRKQIDMSITRELPGNVPFAAINQLIHHFLESWRKKSSVLITKIQPIFEEMLEDAVKATFGRHQRGLLAATISEIVSQTTHSLFQDARLLVEKIAALDDRPFTQNDHYLTDLQDKLLARYKEGHSRQAARKTTENPGGFARFADTDAKTAELNQALAHLASAGMTGLTADDLKKLVKADSYETELVAMAQVRAYWQVAYKRIIDNVPMMIDAEIVLPAARAIYEAIFRDLAIVSEDGPGRCRSLLAESPDITRLREELQLRKDRLGQAKEAIRKLGMK